MDFQLQKPQAVRMALEKRKGMNIFLETMVFIVIFWVCAIVQAICVTPGQMMFISYNADYRAVLEAGDLGKMADIALEVSGSDMMIIVSLFSSAVLILIPLLFCRLLQKRNPETLGFTRKGIVREYLLGLGVGFAMFSVAVLLCILTGALKVEGISAAFHPGMFILFVLGFMVQGMGEEALCRGYFMVSVGRRHPMWTAVFANSLVFGALHLLNTGISALAFVNLTLFGIFASLYFIKRGSIWGIGALHSAWNLVQGNFWGLQVSGMQLKCSVFLSSQIQGRSLIHGGAFGPEGGLAVSVVLAAGICLLLRKKEE